MIGLKPDQRSLGIVHLAEDRGGLTPRNDAARLDQKSGAAPEQNLAPSL